MKNNILILAGEPSGDIRGGELIKALHPILNNIEFWGFGGDNMHREGVEIVRHIRDLSMVGAVEIIHKFPDIFKHYKQIERLVDERKPQMAILIDYPGFNLRVARMLNKRGIPVVYYIIPQVWAWGRGRIKKIKKYVKKALVLFPFEKKLMEENGIDCDFVGHPITDTFAKLDISDSHLYENHKKTGIRIGFLPGSRLHEINYMFPIMLEAGKEIKTIMPETEFLLAESSNIDRSLYDKYIELFSFRPGIRVRDNTPMVLQDCDMAIITSGTATLEGAMMEKPMIVVYKASAITYIFYLLLSRIPFLGLVNIIAGKEVAPELLQHELNSRSLAQKTLEIIKDPERMSEMRISMKQVKDSMGEVGAPERAARSIARLYESLYRKSV